MNSCTKSIAKKDREKRAYARLGRPIGARWAIPVPSLLWAASADQHHVRKLSFSNLQKKKMAKRRVAS